MDNPFFTYEIRQLTRNPSVVQRGLALGLGAMALEVAAWVFLYGRFVDSPFVRIYPGPFVWLLSMTHVGLCALAGAYGGYRIFARDHLRKTFEPLQLLPIPPARWLLYKLVFPVLCVLVCTLAGYPIYAIAAACRLVPSDGIFVCLQKPFLTGMAVLVIALLVTPEYQSLQRRYQLAQAGGRKRHDPKLTTWGSLIAFAGMGTGFGVLGAALDTDTPFFTTSVPAIYYWLGGFAAVVPAAWLTARAALRFSERAEHAAGMARFTALAALNLGMAGLLWWSLPWWTRCLFLSALPLSLLYAALQKGERREDSLSVKEVSWVQSRWDNPLLIHDLRVFSRHTSIRRLWLYTACGLITCLLLLVSAINYIGIDGVIFLMSWALGQGAIQTSTVYWTRSRLLWQKEWTGGTLPLLLLTPLTDSEIILGRFLAVPIYFWTGISALLVPAVAMLVWANTQTAWMVGPLLLAFCPCVVSLGLATSVRTNRSKFLSSKFDWRDWRLLLLSIAQTITLALAIHMAFADGFKEPFLNLLPLNRPTCWLIAAILCASNAALAAGWFRYRVRQLRRFREHDMETMRVPGSEGPAPKRSPLFARRESSRSADD